MDLIEKTMNQKRHPWELSRTEMIIRLYKRYAEKMRGVMVADIGAGDCFFDCQLVTVDSHIEKIIAIDINYREAPAVDLRIILKNNISELDADSIDVIFMMDVLEHVSNDGAFLREVASKVKSEGLIVITVPAYPSLFSSHDRFLKHYRRYTHERLRKLIECNELQILSHHYFYLSLWIVRWLQVNIGLFGTKSDTGIGTWPYSSSNFVTKIVKHALNLDFLMNEIVHKFGISIPGLSLLAVCKKKLGVKIELTNEGMEMKRITILVPCYNEEAVLPVFYMKLCEIVKNMDCYSRYQFFVLFVDDGSDDKTLEIMKQLHNHNHNVSYLSLSRNFGKEVAMLAGMDYVDSDAVIIMDADLQDPDLIPQMICEWEQGYNSVYAKRRSRNGETWVKKMTAHIYYRIYASLTHMPDTVDVGDFRLLDRQCIEALRTIRERERYTKGLFNWIGYRQKAVLYDRPPRKYGNTKWTYWRLIHLALEGVTSFSTIPLHISSWLGMIVSACSFIYTIFIVMRTLIYGGDVPGYPSLVAIILFVGGVQLIVLGIIGEYLGRIFKESKRRPAYLIDEFNGDKVYGNKAEPLL